MSKTTGIEIDGTKVRVASINGDKVLYREYEGTNTDEAIEAWLKDSKPRGDYVITWSGPAVVREATIPGCPDEILPTVLLDTAQDAVPVDGHMVGGVVSSDPEADGTRAALLGSVEASQLALVYKKLGKAAPVVLAPFSYTQDGIYLAVRAGNVEMTLVQGGKVVATRVLGVDGIDELSAALASGVDARTRIGEYADELVSEVRETQRAWALNPRFDANVSTIYIHGLGADVPGLREKIVQSTGLRVAEPPVAGVDLTSLDGQAHKAYQALIAAASGAVERPGILLRSPAAERAAREKATREKKRSMFTLGLIGAALLLVAMAAPVVIAQRNLADAEGRYDSAVREFRSLEQFDRLAHESREFTSAAAGLDEAEPNFPAILAWLQDKAPAGTTLSNMTAQLSGDLVNVELSAVVEAGPFIGPAEWLKTLLEEEGIPYAWVDSSSVEDENTGQVRVSMTIQLPDDTRFFYVSDNEFNPANDEAADDNSGGDDTRDDDADAAAAEEDQ